MPDCKFVVNSFPKSIAELFGIKENPTEMQTSGSKFSDVEKTVVFQWIFPIRKGGKDIQNSQKVSQNFLGKGETDEKANKTAKSCLYSYFS